MVLLETPICDFGTPIPSFSVIDTEGKVLTEKDVLGPNGLLVIFMCNHCPYVKAIMDRLEPTAQALSTLGVGMIAINPNDPTQYPEDSREAMIEVSQNFGFSFPYCIDQTQEVAKSFGAVCTPDFFGYNADLALQYRGRLDDARMNKVEDNTNKELIEAMTLVAKTGKGPSQQIPSMGCSIKWK